MPKSLSRKDNHRKSLLRNLATSLVLYEEIKTTKAKAKEVKPIVEKLINRAKKSQSNNLVVRRKLLGYFFDKNATRKVFEVYGPRYAKINSGFVKTYNLGSRLGDNAHLVLLKLVPGEEPKEVISQPIDKDKSEKSPKEPKKEKTTARFAKAK